MYLLDSNIIISFFRSSEETHGLVKEFMNTLDAFAVHDYVLLEIATVLQLKEGKKIANKAVGLLTMTKNVLLLRLTDEELEETVHFFAKQSKKLSFADASLIVLAHNRGFKLATMDKNLIKAAKKF